MRFRLPIVVAVFAAFSAILPAHGGQYRGPAPPMVPANQPPGMGGRPKNGPTTPRLPAVPKTGVPSGPTTPGGGQPGAGPVPGATTGGGDFEPDGTSWETWWEINKDPFVRPRIALAAATISGSDDFYLGPRRPEARVDLLAPTEADRLETIVPALAALLAAERHPDVATACLVALAKLGLDAPTGKLEELLSPFVAREDQEVRETAALSLGIGGRAAAVPILLALLRDDAVGRKLVGRSAVAGRTRAFAAFGLGQLLWHVADPAQATAMHDALWAIVSAADEQDRELRVAAVTALGLAGGRADRPGQKRLAWQTVDELLGYLQKDLGRGEEFVQAHAPVAIARLLRRGGSDLQQKCKVAFAAIATERSDRGNALVQGAALALGGLVRPEEEAADDAPFARALQQVWEKGHDRMARNFAVIALGRIGGAANRAWLLKAYDRGNKQLERPWLALALGLCAHGRATPDAEIAELLLDEVANAAGKELQGAAAIALGLTQHTPTTPRLLKLLQDHEADEHLAGHLCMALGLLGDRTAVPTLASVLERSSRRPFLLQQAALALGRLGDVDATPRLLTMLKDSESTAVLAALATALGQIGDRRAIEPLVAATRDKELTALSRAFAAAALGGIGDKDAVRWNTPLLIDVDYASATDTLTNGATGVLDIL